MVSVVKMVYALHHLNGAKSNPCLMWISDTIIIIYFDFWVDKPERVYHNIIFCQLLHTYYSDIIMSAMASHITSLTIVYSIVYSGADQRKHQSSASPHKWPVTRKMFPFDDVIMTPGKPVLFPLLCSLRCVQMIGNIMQVVLVGTQIIIIIMRNYLKSLSFLDTCQVYSIECVFNIYSILSVIFCAIYVAGCFQLIYFSFDYCQNISIQSYHHHQLGNMNF